MHVVIVLSYGSNQPISDIRCAAQIDIRTSNVPRKRSENSTGSSHLMRQR